jgi:hypothetical protein
MKNNRQLTFRLILTRTTKLYLTLTLLLFTCLLQAQTVSISTDQDDYYPGEWVVITGTGWTPGDSVQLSITHVGDNIPNHTHVPWILVADASGNLSDQWYVGEMELNTTLWLQAQSLSNSAMRAEKVFTDASTLSISGTVELTDKTLISGAIIKGYKDSGLTTVERTTTSGPDGSWILSFPKDVTRYVVITPPRNYSCSGVIISYPPPSGGSISQISNNEIKVSSGNNGGSSTANKFLLVLNNPTPTISTISPNFICTGADAFTLTINGTNFISTSSVQFNGTVITTNFINSGQLNASISATDIEQSGTCSIAVLNPAPGGGTSSSAILTVNALPPAPSTESNFYFYDGNNHLMSLTIGTGETISWYDSPSGGNLLPEVPSLKNVGSITAYAELRNTTTGCISKTRTSVTLTVTPRPITITANAKSKTYGNVDPALTYQITSGSLAFSDAFSGALTRVIGEKVGNKRIIVAQG